MINESLFPRINLDRDHTSGLSPSPTDLFLVNDVVTRSNTDRNSCKMRMEILSSRPPHKNHGGGHNISVQTHVMPQVYAISCSRLKLGSSNH